MNTSKNRIVSKGIWSNNSCALCMLTQEPWKSIHISAHEWRPVQLCLITNEFTLQPCITVLILALHNVHITLIAWSSIVQSNYTIHCPCPLLSYIPVETEWMDENVTRKAASAVQDGELQGDVNWSLGVWDEGATRTMAQKDCVITLQLKALHQAEFLGDRAYNAQKRQHYHPHMESYNTYLACLRVACVTDNHHNRIKISLGILKLLLLLGYLMHSLRIRLSDWSMESQVQAREWPSIEKVMFDWEASEVTERRV